MATTRLDAEQLAILLCQQFQHGGSPDGKTACPRGEREVEIERAEKLIRLYGATGEAGKAKKDAGEGS